MKWLNIEVSTLRSEQYIGSDPIARATWLNVLAWCCEQENGGRIEGAASWGDRRWQQTCGVTKDEVGLSAPLLVWDIGALIVWNYPLTKQQQVQHNREIGSIGGQAKTQAKAEAARVNGAKHQPKEHPSASQAETQAEAKQDPSERPNGRERKGIGREEEGKGTIALDLEATADAAARGRKKPRTVDRNPILDALAVIGGGKAEEIPPGNWAGIAKALSEIRAVCPELTIEELQRRARNYRTRFEGAALTPFALAKHWATCGTSKWSEQGSQVYR